ncbi:NEDD8-activating enzyme E1 regulatory subunit-like isoform X2 [Polyodon spathula]|uniref:NEDD8-activating enzyme E1 regulatory subunit-like isoform X2 n=1 Tax=Polyodon spathula TaxID=7913 RepID=UPI001B7DF805|nr:NEDD8-activating enzyme E1 regulatory subunit-like isoform X2 [Polyodon spathula]
MFGESARALCKRKRNEFKSGSVAMASVDKGKSTKKQKYDRQLRLWGDHGQDALENAHVCLINACATGTEILKNLVLPAFTIVDGHKVSGDDAGNNFFLTKSSIGRNRAQAATELLQELNNDVSGNFVEESPDKLLDNDPDFFCRFSLVIAVHLPESTILCLAAFLWGAGVPLLVCRTYGLIGYMRLVVKEHTVVESHPDNALENLRLDHPFPELKKHIQSYALENMEKRDHSHTPWIIVMAKYLEKWRSEHNSRCLRAIQKKKLFENLFDKISSGVDELLQDENSKNIKAQVFINQVEEDIGKLKSCVNSLLQENGLVVNVKDDYIHEFCR